MLLTLWSSTYFKGLEVFFSNFIVFLESPVFVLKVEDHKLAHLKFGPLFGVVPLDPTCGPWAVCRFGLLMIDKAAEH